MRKVLKYVFEAGSQNVEVPDNLKILACLHADLNGVVLMVEVVEVVESTAEVAPVVEGQ